MKKLEKEKEKERKKKERADQLAKEQAENGRYAMIAEDTVYEWVSDYYINYELPKKGRKKQQPKNKEKIIKKDPINNVSKSSQSTTNNEKVGNEQQIELFELV